MPARRADGDDRLGPIQTLGAWLHLWTPPRGVDVPPVPWVAIVIGAIVTTGVIAGAVALITPAIDSGKRRGAKAERASLAAARAAERRRLVIDQRARSERVAAPDGDARARSAVLARLEASITADVRDRQRSGGLSGHVQGTECRPFRGSPVAATAPVGKFECVAVTSQIPGLPTSPAGTTGYPFWARVDYDSGRIVWCKINPRAGERGIGHELAVVAPPPACDLRRG
jgi:hypothetical protein